MLGLKSYLNIKLNNKKKNVFIQLVEMVDLLSQR